MNGDRLRGGSGDVRRMNAVCQFAHNKKQEKPKPISCALDMKKMGRAASAVGD